MADRVDKEPRTGGDASPAADASLPLPQDDDDAFWALVAAAARSGLTRAAFIEVLESYRLAPEERGKVLARFTSGRD
jgi:hypothetical protein